MILRIARAEVRQRCIDMSSSVTQNASCRRMVAACGITCADIRLVSTAPLSSLRRTFLYLKEAIRVIITQLELCHHILFRETQPEGDY